MGRRHRAKRRDDNEAAIVAALKAAGASVSQIDGDEGEPDLLVGLDGRTELMEVKREDRDRRAHGGGGASRPGRGGDGVLTAPQLEWRAGWRGKPAHLVATPSEALAAIGATKATRALEEPDCPGPNCPMCSGAVCVKCGAGATRNPAVDGVLCEHDGAERYEEPTPRRRVVRRPKLITSDEARTIRADLTPVLLCDRMGHPRVVSTQHCACGHQLYPEVEVAPPPAPKPRKRLRPTVAACAERTNHAQVAGTSFCACGHAMYD